MTSFTDIISIGKGLLAGLIPSKTIACGSATFPSWVMFTYLKFRLPFCHTSPTTKHLLTMKVTSRAGNILTTPRAFFSKQIRTSAIWFAYLRFCPALQRTILLRPIACVCYILSALEAISFINLSPTSQEVTLTRAISSCILSTIFRVKKLTAILTIQGYIKSLHTYIIPQKQIEEKYCEIAAKRLSQSVMKL